MLGKHSPNSATPKIYYSVFYALNLSLKHSLLSWFRDIVKQNKGHVDTSTKNRSDDLAESKEPLRR